MATQFAPGVSPPRRGRPRKVARLETSLTSSVTPSSPLSLSSSMQDLADDLATELEKIEAMRENPVELDQTPQLVAGSSQNEKISFFVEFRCHLILWSMTLILLIAPLFLPGG